MKRLKIQIVLFYYDRPKLVRKMALKTVFESSYDNWELSIIDDSTDQNSDNVMEKFYEENPHFFSKKDNVKIFKTSDTLEEKKQRGDAIFGKFANDAILSSNADICIMLCDDDGVTKNYFSDLNTFFIENPEANHSYCRIIVYNPVEGGKSERSQGEWVEGNSGLNYEKFNHTPDNWLNGRPEITHLHNHCDSSMVSWRKAKAIKDTILFNYPKTANLDSDLYLIMDRKWGNCQFNGIIGQYKAFWKGQLGNIQWESQDVRYVPTDI